MVFWESFKFKRLIDDIDAEMEDDGGFQNKASSIKIDKNKAT